MAVFGYVVYTLITLFVSYVSLVVWSWHNHTSEKWFMMVVFIAFWTGAYLLWPFQPMMLK